MRTNQETIKAAEMSALSSAILDTGALSDVLIHLRADDFTRPENRAVYEAMQRLIEADKPVDFLMLQKELDSDGAVNAAGGIDYLLTLNNYAPSAANIEHYIATVAKNGQEKRVSDAMRIIYKSEDELLPQLESLVERERVAIKPVGDGSKLSDQITAFMDRMRNPKPMQRIRTGITTLDKYTGGLPKRSISIIGARPGVGKTAAVLKFSKRALDDSQTVAVFSLEMPYDQLLERYASMLSHINYTQINQNRVTDEPGLTRIETRLWELQNGDRLHLIDDVSSVTGIISEIARIKPDIAFIDYIQIVEPARAYREVRREMAETTRALKKAAKKYDCHICCLSQLSRDAQEREPTMADLAECGAMEQQFDYVMLLHRPPEYIASKDVGGEKALLKVDKNKYGQTARLPLMFDGAHQNFYEAETRRAEPDRTTEG